MPTKPITLWINVTGFMVGIIPKIMELVYSLIRLKVSKLFVYSDKMLYVRCQIR